MQLKIYDILSSLIPGTLVFGVMLLSYFLVTETSENTTKYVGILKDLSGITTTFFLTISYLIGYLIHALGSWIEPFLWFTWGGRPSEILLKNKSNRLGMVFYQETLEYLMQRLNLNKKVEELETQDYKKLFQVAKNAAFKNAEGKSEERLTGFNNSYIFSRNILIAIIVSFFIAVSNLHHFVHWVYLVISVVVLILLWFRCRDKAIYYSREILTIAYSKK